MTIMEMIERTDRAGRSRFSRTAVVNTAEASESQRVGLLENALDSYKAERRRLQSRRQRIIGLLLEAPFEFMTMNLCPHCSRSAACAQTLRGGDRSVEGVSSCLDGVKEYLGLHEGDGKEASL